jgi:hypothetical protein
MRVRSNGKKVVEMAVFAFLSPVRLPFRHTGISNGGAVNLAEVSNTHK